MSEFGNSLKGSLSSAGKWAGDLPTHLKNEVCTIGDVAEKVPSAIWNELHGDITTGFKGHAERGIACGFSALIGAGTLLLARRAPGIMAAISESSVLKATASVGAAGEGITFLSGASSLIYDGWNADTTSKREELAEKVSVSASKNLAPIVESVAAGGIGALTVDRALAYSPKFNAATFESLTERRDYFFRSQFQSDRGKLFSGNGSFDLSAEVALGGTRANMNALTTEIEQAPVSRLQKALFHNDSNVEVVREINLADGRVSVPLRGTPWGSRTTTLPEGLTDHNHHNLAGILISTDDAVNARGLNIVRSGDYRGYFVGQREKLAAGQAGLGTIISESETPPLPALNQLVVNDKVKRAFLLQSPTQHLDSATNHGYWLPEPKYVDYSAAKSLLNGIETSTSGAEKAFETLPKISSELHPDDLRAITPFRTNSPGERRIKLAGDRG